MPRYDVHVCRENVDSMSVHDKDVAEAEQQEEKVEP